MADNNRNRGNQSNQDWDQNRNRDDRRMNEMRTSGGHRGKGPKGYHRSEERIREDAYERLTYDDRVDASNIDVQVQGEDLILTGTVNSKEEKWRAEDIVENISGIRNVENRIRIGRGEEASSRGSMSSATGSASGTSMPTSTGGSSGSNMTTNTGGSGIGGTTDSERTTGSETTGSRRDRNK